MTDAWLTNTTQKKVPIKLIKVKSERGRKEFKRIDELASSIKEKGLINPLLVMLDDEGKFYELIAGERRYRASVLAGLLEVPITLGDGLTNIQLKALELEENVCRQDLTAMEEAELMRQIDDLRRKTNPNWTQKETAALVNKTPALISAQIKVAKALNKNPKLREEVKNLDIRTAAKVIERNEQVKKMERLRDQGSLDTRVDLRHGSCIDLIKSLPDDSVDLVITDPPYGSDKFETLRTGAYSTGTKIMNKTHNLTLGEVGGLLSELSVELSRVMKPGAHLYCFVPQQYLTDFLRFFHTFEFQYPPLIWNRGRNTQPGYGYNYINYTESILYLHNPPRTKRLNKNMGNVLQCPEVPRGHRQFHTEKPQGLLETLINQSSILGATVLDPFAGSGSTLLAARDLGRSAIGFEIDEDTYKRATLRLAGELLDEN